MGAVRSLEFGNNTVQREAFRLVHESQDVEVPLLLSGTIEWHRAIITNILKIEGAQQSSTQTSFTWKQINQTDMKFNKMGENTIAQGHSHIEKNWHAHHWSNQDKKAMKQQETDTRMQVHALFFRRENAVDVKASNNQSKPIDVIADGVKNNVLSLFKDGSVQATYDQTVVA